MNPTDQKISTLCVQAVVAAYTALQVACGPISEDGSTGNGPPTQASTTGSSTDIGSGTAPTDGSNTSGGGSPTFSSDESGVATTANSSTGSTNEWNINVEDIAPGLGAFVDGPAVLSGIGASFAFVEGWGQDGIDDLVFGGYLVLVDGAYTAPIDLASADTIGQVIKISGVPGFRDGYASVGDANGDEVEDLVVGEPSFFVDGDEEGHPPEGRSHLIWGPMEPKDIEVPLLFEQGLGSRVTGVEYGQKVGASVGSAGDANGDGFSDVVMSIGSTRTAVVFGDDSPMSLTTLDIEAGLTGYTIETPNSGLLLPLGDVNDDGLADHVQIGSGNTGSTLSVIYGKKDGNPVTLDQLKVGTGGFIIEVSSLYTASDNFGVSGASLGDFDGDGWNDLVVSAGGTAPIDRQVLIVRGAKSWGQPSLATLQAEGRVRLFGGAGGPVGALSFVDDLTGDGRDELLAGVAFMNTAYLIFGQDGVDTIDLDTLSDDKAGVRFYSVDHIGLGRGVIGTNDLTGDNVVDLVLGGPQASPRGRFGAGRVYIVSGAALMAWL